jgi:hypothetical protein
VRLPRQRHATHEERQLSARARLGYHALARPSRTESKNFLDRICACRLQLIAAATLVAILFTNQASKRACPQGNAISLEQKRPWLDRARRFDHALITSDLPY